MCKGRIEVICGPMFSGKTEELIRRIKRVELAKRSLIAFKPKIDNRYSESEMVSHSNLSFPTNVISKAEEILNFIFSENSKFPKFDVIAIDEVQFLDEQIIKICNQLANNGVRVIVAGLDQSYTGEPFDITAKLMGVADSVTKLNSVCSICGEPGSKSYRISNSKDLIEIGATNSYMALCRDCFYKKTIEDVTKSCSEDLSH